MFSRINTFAPIFLFAIGTATSANVPQKRNDGTYVAGTLCMSMSLTFDSQGWQSLTSAIDSAFGEATSDALSFFSIATEDTGSVFSEATSAAGSFYSQATSASESNM